MGVRFPPVKCDNEKLLLGFGIEMKTRAQNERERVIGYEKRQLTPVESCCMS